MPSQEVADIVPRYRAVQLLNRVLQNLARTKLGLGACLDLHRLASPRIAASRCLAACDGEIAEILQDEPRRRASART